MKKTIWLLVSALFISILGSTSSFAAIKTQTVEYKQGDTVLEGYLAYDDASTAKRPGVAIVHDWTGLGDFVKKRAEQIAKLGYVALALDIYGKGVRAKNPEEAGKLAKKYKSDRALMRARATAGLDYLKSNPLVDPSKLAAMGYCFGGTTVLELARSGAPLKALASFHGGLDTPHVEDAKKIKAKVLVMTGGDDPSVPAEQVTAFESEMRNAKVDWQLISYGGAVHAFTNPDAGNDNSKGAAYNEEADRKSWREMKEFFEETLK
jgi:dienelactone hydrolase